MTDKPKTVDASPTKKFFVEMLTRDIKLEDAILDMLDNCVDGILRSGQKKAVKPYGNFKADIKFDAESFSITDNCGGIPWDMNEYAFRMGRPAKKAPAVDRSVGVYGIGMKRAIFKIGRRCTIHTRSTSEQYEVKITRDWMEKEYGDDAWKFPVKGPVEPKGSPRTAIVVRDLNKGVAEMFAKGRNKKLFSSGLIKSISAHYAYIIEKGFQVTVNGEAVKPTTVRLAFDKEWRHGDAIVPFVFEGEADGVEVYLAVGLTGRIPSRGRIGRERAGTTRPTSDPGWTIVCNDRVVLSCDRTKLTGWGERTVPQYHTQFAPIAGIVEFRSKYPSKLPTTTTKTGVDASADVYLQVKRKMLEGMRIFVNYTNKWKGRVDDMASHADRCDLLSLDELKSKRLQFEAAHALTQSKQYKPSLPAPSEPDEHHIAFKKDKRKIEAVSKRLFGKPDIKPSRVGAECFDIVYEETLR